MGRGCSLSTSSETPIPLVPVAPSLDCSRSNTDTWPSPLDSAEAPHALCSFTWSGMVDPEGLVEPLWDSVLPSDMPLDWYAISSYGALAFQGWSLNLRSLPNRYLINCSNCSLRKWCFQTSMAVWLLVDRLYVLRFVDFMGDLSE